MGIYIKGLEMPKGSHTVTITIVPPTAVPGGKAYVEYYDNKAPVRMDVEYDVVNIQKHGDLIDRKELNREIDKVSCYSCDPFVTHMSQCINDAAVLIGEENV